MIADILPRYGTSVLQTISIKLIRKLNPKLSVDTGYVAKIPFDLIYWQSVADEAGALPEPHSDDPTQWLAGNQP
ncbi:MAG: hypothetical protein WKF84_14630 [Pyrinomonadaceae bacterium]